MPLSDQERLNSERVQPRIIELHRALVRLKSTVSFMNSGAHPDDETSAMLAVLLLRDGLDISTACANRGEGGQNDIGTETGRALGAVRTAEMEQAAKVLGLRHYWLSTHINDSVFDFGFSKDGEQTLHQWRRDRALQRFVSIVRRERPDILCPTFLDVPGQHGHHRAMTMLAHDVIACAADSGFIVDESCDPGLAPAYPRYKKRRERVNTPWQVSKLYLPAWGGGGGAYDDELPPPDPTLIVAGCGRDSISGWSYENIAQQSRKYHKTQGMGRWVGAGSERDWPLHLAWSCVEGPDNHLEDGLLSSLAKLADLTEHRRLKTLLIKAHELSAMTLDAATDFSAVFKNAFATLDHIQQALKLIESEGGHDEKQQIVHRLKRKEEQLSRIVMLASGIQTAGYTNQDWWYPDDDGKLTIEQYLPDWLASGSTSSFEFKVNAHPPWHYNADTCVLSLSDTQPSNPYPDTWLADEPDEPNLQLSLTLDGTCCNYLQALEVRPVIGPVNRLQLKPEKFLINTLEKNRHCDIRISQQHPEHASVTADLPPAWQYRSNKSILSIMPPLELDQGVHHCSVFLDNKQANQTVKLEYPHIEPRLLVTPASISFACVPIALPDVRVGYVGGGNDTVDEWLIAMGMPLTRLEHALLVDTAELRKALGKLDTLVIGVFAYRMAQGLSKQANTINKWVHEGGHLLTLYHRPWDNWHPATIPPKPITIGTPSLRFRVTDENAEVNYLLPEHVLLNTPNVITAHDWQGWYKERGLYFAKSWDNAYEALISMSDPGETAHRGALLSASIGRGRHTHTSLNLHYQLQALVPGSFRLMANLVG